MACYPKADALNFSGADEVPIAQAAEIIANIVSKIKDVEIHLEF